MALSRPELLTAGCKAACKASQVKNKAGATLCEPVAGGPAAPLQVSEGSASSRFWEASSGKSRAVPVRPSQRRLNFAALS